MNDIKKNIVMPILTIGLLTLILATSTSLPCEGEPMDDSETDTLPDGLGSMPPAEEVGKGISDGDLATYVMVAIIVAIAMFALLFKDTLKEVVRELRKGR